jgi:predicted alpha/beta-fold hydrolase
LLQKIRVPSLIIAAADDPVIPVKIFDNLEMSSNVDLHITGSGGHLGYVGSRTGDLDWRWLDWRLIEQVLGAVPQQNDPSAEQEIGKEKASDLV